MRYPDLIQDYPGLIEVIEKGMATDKTWASYIKPKYTVYVQVNVTEDIVTIQKEELLRKTKFYRRL